MKTRIKICGITNYYDAKFCINNGVDYIGFIFYNKSPRYISPEKARTIILKLGKAKIRFAGVFVNEKLSEVNHISSLCGLDVLQIHGDENKSFFRNLRKTSDKRIIKSIRMKDEVSLRNIEPFDSDFFLFDSFSKTEYGGTGKSFDFKLIKNISKPFFLAGGLNSANIETALKNINPFGVDMNSGVEKSPGVKDHNKILEIIKIIRRENK